MRDIEQTEQAGGDEIDCSRDPIGSLVKMFVELTQGERIKRGQSPALRPVFLKPHGVAAGEFIVREELPEALRIGLFGKPGARFPAWMRFSSDTVPTVGDFQTTLGIGIKLFGVEGAKLLDDPDDTTFDFILQNFEVFFLDTAADMCAFTKAGIVDRNYDKYLDAHPATRALLDAMAKPVASVLATPYWSGVPFRLGSGAYVKYKLEPVLSLAPLKERPDDPTYLAGDLRSRLSQAPAGFRFMVQLRSHPDEMPIDQATVAWSEELSPPIHVADLALFKQDISARGQAEYGENLAMNIWRVSKDHEPVGSLADARRAVYAASAKQRRDVNGIPIGEPDEPRPVMTPPSAVDSVIVLAAIHPAIGIARIGDSKTDYFIGPELADEPIDPATAETYRDDIGAIKRQAARFRIYGYNAVGKVVRELTSENAHIAWTVHVANRKAQWYQFQYALDIPEAVNAADNKFPLRNADITDRKALAIDPGPRSISGANRSGGKEYAFDTGTFQARLNSPVTVPLGEICTDDVGRLIFLGGWGNSKSPTNAPVFDDKNGRSFNNANDWYDDTSDGPVTAEVSINGRPVPVTGAWVVTAPPNYAPGIVSWRTMYDEMCDVYVQSGWLKVPETPSFVGDILPILSRLSGLQWVNAGFAAYFAKGGVVDFTSSDLLSRLSHKPDTAKSPDPYASLRRAIYHSFRPAKPRVPESVSGPHVWPWIYGDAFGSFPANGTGNLLAMTGLQDAILRQWVEGDFRGDWPPAKPAPARFEDVPLAGQPAMLDRAALHYCLADTFHPGCELTWPMRHASLYSAPFRVRARPASEPEPDYGSELTPVSVAEVGGPLYSQPPGGLTRWMAIPWQGDTAFCRSGYDPEYDPFLPTFWATRVPNQVLTEEDYAKVMDGSLPREERIAAFNERHHWLRAIMKGGVATVMMRMTELFGQLGIVEIRPGIKGDPDFPEQIYVESLAAGQVKLLAVEAAKVLAQTPRPLTHLEKAGWESQEQLDAFRAVRVRNR